KRAAAEASIESSSSAEKEEKNDHIDANEVVASVATTVSEAESEPVVLTSPKEETRDNAVEQAAIEEQTTNDADESGDSCSNADANPASLETIGNDRDAVKVDGETAEATINEQESGVENAYTTEGLSNSEAVVDDANNVDDDCETVEAATIDDKEAGENGHALSNNSSAKDHTTVVAAEPEVENTVADPLKADPSLLPDDLKEEGTLDDDNAAVGESSHEPKVEEQQQNGVYIASADPILAD
ncbi:MAG: hypothetical protein SGARI_001117, partial [Bacillariaceae sp.]